MDILQIALIFLILLLSAFLSILGIQVFFILKDLKKSLDKFDKMIDGLEIADSGVKQLAKVVSPKPKPSRRLFIRR